jgi:hypothetical protein
VTSVEDIIERLKKYYNEYVDYKLAQKLGLPTPTISTWKRRGTIDLFRLIPICKDINWHWLITGEGEMKYDAQKEAKSKAQVEYLLRRINELEAQNKLLVKLLEKFVSREEKEKIESASGESQNEDEIAWIKNVDVDKVISVPYLKETPEEAPEVKKETNKL